MVFPSIVYPSFGNDQPLKHRGTEKLVPDTGRCSADSEERPSVRRTDGGDIAVQYLVEIRERRQVGKDRQEICWRMFHMR